ncbi:MAG: ATP-binding cassette domain-containing protein, partial [Mycoplasmataceae bacterium]|nr:ATP-binding cassette domain-containing protein [Mycoplasmataceae bacterium]
MGLAIAVVYILKNIYMLIFTKFNNEILQDLSVNITTKIIKNLLFQDYLKVNKIPNEEKINVISKVNFVVWQYCSKYINLTTNCAIATILLGYLFYKFTICATVAFGFILILALIEYKILKKNSTHQNKHFSTCFDEMNSLILNTISSIKEIKLNNLQEIFIEKIENKCKDYAILNKNRSFCDVFHIYFTEISIMLAFIVILGVLFFTTNFDNQVLITTISTICIIILRLTPVINRAQSCLYSLNSNKSIVLDLINFDNKFNQNFVYSTQKEKLNFTESIELENISFSFDNQNGIKNLNLKIKKGEFVGIVGKSGCYKTTLSLIIASLIKPQEGYLKIDDKKLNEIELQKWQNNIALMSQDYSILFDSIKENEYLEKMNLKNIANIKELSFGERQRLALANILSQDKEVLILDEITSSSDVINEEKINEILLELKGQKTIIAIAHRLQILKHCSKIIYMDNGKIVDIDSFSTLSNKYEEFKKMIELSNFKI